TNDPKLIAKADKIVFPGVGAMRDCMQGMRDAGIDEVVRHAAFNKPVVVTMHKIKTGILLNVVPHWMARIALMDLIPAHMRYFKAIDIGEVLH
ncbi:hypothetical protein ACW7EJ_00015, partial [Acinetobacter soli]